MTCCHGQQLKLIEQIEMRGSHRKPPDHTGNRILVARGNNWIQYGCHIKNREKLTDCAQSKQEVELLVARGNN